MSAEPEEEFEYKSKYRVELLAREALKPVTKRLKEIRKIRTEMLEGKHNLGPAELRDRMNTLARMEDGPMKHYFMVRKQADVLSRGN